LRSLSKKCIEKDGDIQQTPSIVKRNPVEEEEVEPKIEK